MSEVIRFLSPCCPCCLCKPDLGTFSYRNDDAAPQGQRRHATGVAHDSASGAWYTKADTLCFDRRGCSEHTLSERGEFQRGLHPRWMRVAAATVELYTVGAGKASCGRAGLKGSPYAYMT